MSSLASIARAARRPTTSSDADGWDARARAAWWSASASVSSVALGDRRRPSRCSSRTSLARDRARGHAPSRRRPSAPWIWRTPSTRPRRSLRLERGVVVRPVQPAAEGEVLLDADRAQRHRGDRCGDARRVVGEPDRDTEALAQRLHGAQVDLLGRARVVRGALHDRNGEPCSRSSATAAVISSIPDMPWRSGRGVPSGDGLDQRRVGHLARRDLVGGHAELLEQLDGLDREGRGEEDQPPLLGVGLERRVLLAPSSIRRVNSKRGSSKWGGVGVDGSISALAMWVWNFTASAPASAAASIRAFACPMLPSWLLPISAITKAGAPAQLDVPRSPCGREIYRSPRFHQEPRKGQIGLACRCRRSARRA